MRGPSNVLILFLFLGLNIQSVFAEITSNDDLARQIDKTVGEIETYAAQYKNKTKEYLINDVDGKLKIIEWGDDVPKGESEAVYRVLYDKQGRILKHVEIPTSISGDWYEEGTHYFDRNGNTIMYMQIYYDYSSGCTHTLKATTRYYFDPQFTLIKKTEKYTDNDGKPINNLKECVGYGSSNDKVPSGIETNYANVKKRINAELIKYEQIRIKQQDPYGLRR